MMEYDVKTGLSVEESLERMLENIKGECEDETVSLKEALLRIAAKDCRAESPVPDFARSAMDGYAVRSDDIKGACRENPVRFKVTGQILAGDKKDISYQEKSAVRIMTGGRIPEGYDAVVKQEDTDMNDKEVEIYTSLKPFTNYCPIGENIKKGQILVKKGGRIGRIEAGLLASSGINEITVKKEIRTALISTGSELTAVGEKKRDNNIYSSISYMIEASLRAEGLKTVLDEICPDDKEMIRKKLIEAADMADIIITTGGVSVGKKDLLHDVLDECGADKLFYRSLIQPGTPTIGAVLKGKPVLCLSGNPYAAILNFDLYYWEIVAKLTGSSYYKPTGKSAILKDDHTKINKLRRFIRAVYKDGEVNLTNGGDRSSVIGDMEECNCYIDIPAGRTYKKGDRVTILEMKGR